MPKRWAKMLVLGLTLAAVTIAGIGCASANVDTDLTVYTGDRYDLVMTITFWPQALAGLSDAASMQERLDGSVARAKASGCDVEGERVQPAEEGQLAYRLHIRAAGVQALDSCVQQVSSVSPRLTASHVKYEGHDAIRVQLPASTFGGWLGGDSTLTIHAGKILASNGTQQSKDSVTWHNSSDDMYAVLTPKSQTNLLLPAAVVLLLLGGAGYGLYRLAFAHPHAASTPPPASARYCPYCGQAASPSAQFCPHCGNPMPKR